MDNPSQFQATLVGWFLRTRRRLPWRTRRTPYRTWISEIMLQQTQVATMVPYFNRWMKEIPTIRLLALTDEQKLLRLWQGLGYYSRARNLKKGALYLINHHRGKLPRSVDELLQVPGIGRYTAGAILSLAFNQKAPIADGNVLRVFARLYAMHGFIDLPQTQNHIYALQEKLLPEKNPGDFNEALMELGALICTPKNPDCPACPVKDHCEALSGGLTDKLPRKSRKHKITPIEACAAVIERRGMYLIRQRPKKGLWANLWEFPEWKTQNGAKKEKHMSELAHALGARSDRFFPIATVKHAFTRYSQTLHFYGLKIGNDLRPSGSALYRWVLPKELAQLPLSATHARISESLIIQTEEAAVS